MAKTKKDEGALLKLQRVGCPAPEAHRGKQDLKGLLRGVWAWLKAFVCGMQKARAFGNAAEMAFWLFLSLIPLAAVAGLVAARFALSHDGVVSGALSGTPGSVDDLVTAQLGQVAKWNGGAVGPVAALTFVWLAASGVHSVFDGIEVQVGFERPWWKKRLLAIGTCVALSVGVALLTLLSTGLTWLFHLAGTEAPAALALAERPGVAGVIRFVLAAAVLLGLVSGIYLVGLPRRLRKVMPIVPGAALAVAMHLITGYGYGLYLSQVGSGDAYSAGLSVIGVTLMTLYLFSVALLAGAELNRMIGERRARRLAPDAVAPPAPTPQAGAEHRQTAEVSPQRSRPSLA